MIYKKKINPALGNWFRIFLSRLRHFLYDLKQNAQLELCAPLAIRLGSLLLITVRGGAVTLKGSHRLGGGRNSQKISAPLPLIKIFGMRPLEAISISVDSTFNHSIPINCLFSGPFSFHCPRPEDLPCHYIFFLVIVSIPMGPMSFDFCHGLIN